MANAGISEKTGIPRVQEALEANDWAQLSLPADDLSDFGDFTDPSDKKTKDDDDGKEFDPESLDFGYDKADFEGLRQAIWTSGMPAPDDADAKTSGTSAEGNGANKTELDDEDVEKVGRMMRKLQAVREAGEGMGLEQRQRMAARAVEDVMREL